MILMGLFLTFSHIGSSFADDEGAEFLDRLKSELNLTKAGYRQVLDSVSGMKYNLEEVQNEQATLGGQIRILDTKINRSTEKLFGVIKNIVKKENEVDLLNEQIEMKQVALEYNKDLLGDYVRVIYEQENALLNIDENGEIDAVKLLFADGTAGENLRELEYFDLLNEAGQQMIEKLDSLTAELEEEKGKLQKAKYLLRDLRDELAEEKTNLEFQKISKQNILSITDGQELIYNELLEQSLREQEEVLEELKQLASAVAFIELKIEEDGENFDPDKYLSLLDTKTRAVMEFKFDPANLSFDGFQWPVSPERGINAYFHDPGYASHFGVRHNAIDIAAYQGSKVRSASDGVIYTAKDNGFGYSYIVVAHADGFTTTYGHISNILVGVGDNVTAGSVIGLSGGMPGTKGAGYMTTGPHLHFEVMRYGKYVDPLLYMPLGELSFDNIEWLPEKYHELWAAAELKENVVESRREKLRR